MFLNDIFFKFNPYFYFESFFKFLLFLLKEYFTNATLHITKIDFISYLHTYLLYFWQFCKLVCPFFKIIEFLFLFFRVIIKIFIPFSFNLIEMLKYLPKVLSSTAILGALGVGSFIIAKTASLLTSFIPIVGGAISKIIDQGSEYCANAIKIAYKFFLTIIIFIFDIVKVIFNYLAKFIIQFFKFMYLLIKIWFYILKKIIIVLCFIFKFTIGFIFMSYLEIPDIKNSIPVYLTNEMPLN